MVTIYPSISSEPLIEDEEANWTVKPKFSLFIPLFFDENNILRYFKLSNCLDVLILDLILSSSSRLIFVSNEYLKARFRLENRENFPLEHQILFFRNAGLKVLIQW